MYARLGESMRVISSSPIIVMCSRWIWLVAFLCLSSTEGKAQELINNTITNAPTITNTTTKERACNCNAGVCMCCSKFLYDTWKQKACIVLTYDPDEFSLKTTLSMNDNVLFTRTVSGE